MLLAVYGTLKKGFRNHGFISDAEYKGSYTTAPNFTMVSLGAFPAVYEGGDTPISTEIYDVKDDYQLRRIFQLEGFTGEVGSKKNFYDITNIETPFGEASMFIFKDAKYKKAYDEVKTGIWL